MKRWSSLKTNITHITHITFLGKRSESGERDDACIEEPFDWMESDIPDDVGLSNWVEGDIAYIIRKDLIV